MRINHRWLRISIFFGLVWLFFSSSFTSGIRAANVPLQEPAIEILTGTEASIFQRATASGSMVLETPEQNLFTVGEVPNVATACTGKLGWWWSIILQLGLTAVYVWRRKPTSIQSALAWLAGFSVLAYFVYAAIGCSCVQSSVCSWYFMMNLAILIVGGGVSYWFQPIRSSMQIAKRDPDVDIKMGVKKHKSGLRQKVRHGQQSI
jgi:hypothetical protein